MLSGPVLTQLAKSTALQPDLVAMAWPSLSTESKLQLIDVVCGPLMFGIPDFLLDLGLSDPAPIVRYWAASRAVGQTTAVKADPVELVRAAAEPESIFGLEEFESMGQLARLTRLRHLSFERNSAVAEFIKGCLQDQRVSDEDLASCLYEYFQSDAFARAQEQQGDDDDGYSEWSKGSGIEELWKLAPHAPLKLQHVIAWHAPFVSGMFTMSLQMMVDMPAEVQSVIASRSDDQAESFRQHVNAHPEHFSETVQKSVASYYEDLPPSAAIRREHRFRSMVDREQALYELIGSLRSEIAELRSQVSAAVTRR